MSVRRHRHCARCDEAGAILVRIAIAVVVLALVAGTALELGWLPGRSDGRRTATPASTKGEPKTSPGLSLVAPPRAAPVLPVAAGSSPVDLARLQAHLAAVLALPGLGAHVGFAAAPLGLPGAGWAHGATRVTPASTLKLLTTTAALSELGPDHRFTTSVAQGGSRDSLVLIGGGDPLLTTTAPTGDEASAAYPPQASLEDLATETAARLAVEGISTVRLGYDASLFTGPAVNPRWPSTYIPENVVSPISSLWVNEGREEAGFAQRSADPALDAAEAFRTQLSRTGITVLGALSSQRPGPSGLGRRPVTVAAVSSAPLEQIVEHILEVSDNEGAEVLLRQVAIGAGRPGSSANGVAAVRATLTGLGLDLTGADIFDGSGLSRDDEVPVQLLMDTLQLVASPTHPQLRGVVTGLPVAGFSGSLGYRFDDRATMGRGYVRAKTGTLTGVSGLAGLATTKRGQTLVFVAVADRVPVPQTLAARADLDRIAAALTTCGC